MENIHYNILFLPIKRFIRIDRVQMRFNDEKSGDLRLHSLATHFLRLNIPAGRYFRIKWPVFPVAEFVVLTPGRETRAETGLYAGSCTSAKFVIDTVKAYRAGHYADQEIRIPHTGM